MSERFRFSIILSLLANSIVCTAALADADALVDQAVKQFQAGNTDRAVPLLLQALKEDDKNGKAHYYLSCALKQLGQDQAAANQLEAAVKLCPAGMIESLAKQVVNNASSASAQKPATPQPAPQPAGPQNIFQSVGSWWNGVIGYFSPPSTSNSTSAPHSSGLFTFQMPDFSGGIKDAYSRTRRMIRQGMHDGTPDEEHRPGTNANATVISMGLMQDLASMSHDREFSRRVSQPGGVKNFPQAPEFTPDWDQWIYRFRRIFNIVLTHHLVHAAPKDTTGMASVIFSLDKDGNLVGCIYQSTASDTLNNCLLQTIRVLDHTEFLKFPSHTAITGWNFRMQWDFGRLLSYIKLYRERQAQLQKLAEKKTSLDTNAKIKTGSQKSLTAQMKKLPPTKPPTPQPKPSVNVKTGVAGIVLPKPKPAELKAVPLRLTDLIGKNAAPPADMQDVIDAMNLDMEYQMSEQIQDEGTMLAEPKPGETTSSPPDVKPPELPPTH